MMLNKEECEKALEVLECKAYDGCDKCYSQDEELCKKCEDKDFVEADIIKQLIKEHFELVEKIKTGELSDGYHTFNELYYHRAVLFSVICNSHRNIAWKSKKHHDGTMYDDMFIVGIDTPQGQYSYHYDMNIWSMFDVIELEYAPEWDGHKPSDIERLRSIQNPQPYKFEDLKAGMWVWDDYSLSCAQITKVLPDKMLGVDEFGVKFEDGRFFPIIKGMQYQEPFNNIVVEA